MTRTMRFIAVVMFGALLALSAQPSAQSKGEVALRAAMETETAKGDLKGAIEQYKQIGQGPDRVLAAKALLRMAECYQKLGDAQAQEVYKRLVRDFSDQPGAAEARARLAAPGAATSTLVWQGETSGIDPDSVSLDGRYLSFTDWSTGNLLVRDLTTGTNRVIVPGKRKTPSQLENSPDASTISRDGTQIAYGWRDGTLGRDELWLANLRGEAKPRRLYGDTGVTGLEPSDWSPDGKWIAIELFLRRRSGTELAVVSVDTGQARVLKHTPSFSRIFFSPDGRYIAYDLPQDATGLLDVWVTALDGSTDSAVVANRGNDSVMGWAPDGHLLVASDRRSTTELISVAIHNGTVQGTPEVVKTDMGRTRPLGATTAGSLFYVTERDARGGSIQVAEFDPRSGSVTSRRDVTTNPREDNVNPSWSPDGKYLAYLSGRPRQTPVIVIRAAETGQLVREIEAKIQNLTVLGEWQPDSRALLVFGWDINGRGGAYRVDVETGETSFLLASTGGNVGFIPVWSADGHALYHWKEINDGYEAFFAHDMVSGADKEIVRRPFLGGLTPSPDGRFLATETVEPAKNERVLLLVPLDGAAPREVMRVPAGVPSQDLKRLADRGARVAPTSWLPDSQSFIARLRRQPEDEEELWEIPVNGDSPRKLHSMLEANVFKFTISPDGRHVAYRLKESSAPAPVPVQVWKYSNFLRPGSVIRR
jgi:Tol biopolymer transport system component